MSLHDKKPIELEAGWKYMQVRPWGRGSGLPSALRRLAALPAPWEGAGDLWRSPYGRPDREQAPRRRGRCPPPLVPPAACLPLKTHGWPLRAAQDGIFKLKKILEGDKTEVGLLGVRLRPA